MTTGMWGRYPWPLPATFVFKVPLNPGQPKAAHRGRGGGEKPGKNYARGCQSKSRGQNLKVKIETGESPLCGSHTALDRSTYCSPMGLLATSGAQLSSSNIQTPLLYLGMASAVSPDELKDISAKA